MGFVGAATSTSLHSPLLYPFLFPSSSSSSSSSSRRHRNTNPRSPVVVCCSRHHHDPECNKRTFLFVGVAVLPFLQFDTAPALEGVIPSPIFVFISSRIRRQRLPSSRDTVRSRRLRSIRRQRMLSDDVPLPTFSINVPLSDVVSPSSVSSSASANSEESEVKIPEDKKQAETAPEMQKSSNSFVSLLNGIGIVSSGLLGALYALSQKEKSAAVATIETMNNKLKEKEEQIVSLKRNYELKLSNEQEEQTKLLGKAKEEQNALIDQLNSAKSTVTSLGKELKSEKSFIAELKLQIDRLETNLSKTDTDKKDLENNLKEKVDSIEILQKRIDLLSEDLKDKERAVQNLNSLLADKKLELRNLNTTYDQTNDELSNAHVHIQGLKDEILKSQEKLEGKDSVVMELNLRVDALTLENNNFKSEYDVLDKEFNDLKLTSEKKAVLDAKVLKEREDELHRLTDKLELALNESSKNQVIIADLTQEQEGLKESLQNESKKVNNLKYELQVTLENLENSRNDSLELEKQLNKSNNLRQELALQVSNLSAELNEVKESLQRKLDDVNLEGEKLGNELTTVKEHLKKAEAELQSTSHELTTTLENRDTLQRELIEIYKKAEATSEDLKEEKKLVTSLNKDLQALKKQVLKDKESRKTIETDLDEATKSLDEMNQNSVILSKELEGSKSRISSLENEKEVLTQYLTEQRNASKEAQENIEDAHNLITRLGKERETLESRGKKLEDELASAKGEILRLRSQINTSKSKSVVNNEQRGQKDEGETQEAAVSVRKNVRRRKTNPS
ncbi:MAR-binding filament-like protein 1-1 isoform X1 [Vicia villosa]|uniref:MAR-binding filament-like protein 1-1 isoform X1 n=1 Tax=Vicia villosa TaxID=3911 RepID=UPI00273AD732|nr:MAR-binding filament-like protein 1-1 isoform X1 [Vicia villosa]